MTLITEQGASPHMKSPSKFVTDLVNSVFFTDCTIPMLLIDTFHEPLTL